MTIAVILLLVNTSLFLLLLTKVNKGRINPLAPVTLFNIGFYYSYFFSGFLLQYDFETFLVYPSILTKSEYPLAIYFIPAWLGLVSFNFGYLAKKRKLIQKQVEFTHGPHNKIYALRAAIPSIFLFLSMFSAFAIFYSLQISFLDLISSVEAWELLRNQAMIYWAEANYLYLLPVYVGFFHLCFLSTRNLGRVWSVVLFSLVLTTLIIVGSRALILSWVISLIVFKEYRVGVFSNYFKYAILGIVAVLAAVIGIVQKITAEGASAQNLSFPFNLFRRLQSSYEQFENLFNIINTDFNFDFGRSIFEDVFITYIPRFIFPWKPVDVGFLRAQNILFYNDFWSIDRGTTYPVGIIAELYFNFWYVGIIFGMFGLGMLLRKIEQLAKNEPSYLPVLCALAGTFLAPQRTFGTLILTAILFMTFVFLNNKLFPARS